jgi:hypothetical protein
MKTMLIEELLSWAFCEELCKVGSSGGGDGLTVVAQSNWSVTREMATLGTLIDKSPNFYGVIPGFIEDGEPHADALAVGEAVRWLGRNMFLVIEDGWNPFPDLDDRHGLIAREVERVLCEVRLKGERLSGRHLVGLVTGCAILKRGPDWSAPQPGFRMVMSGGKPAWFVMKKAKDALNREYEFEANGYDAKRCKPVRGAYRKFELDRMMRSDILSRLDWQLWCDALSKIAERLDGRLVAHRIAGGLPVRAPWARLRKIEAADQGIEKVA